MEEQPRFSIHEALADDGAVTREEFRETVIKALKDCRFYGPGGYGLPGNAIKLSVLGLWKQHFALEENMRDMVCPYVMPDGVKETVPMVKDEETGVCYRADHLLKDFCNEILQKDLNICADKAVELKHVLATVDDLSADELGAKIKEYGITAPVTRNPLSDACLFTRKIKMSKHLVPPFLDELYIRPEPLDAGYEYLEPLLHNSKDLPVATAHIRPAYREKIDPRKERLTVHQFTVAEIQHFVDPEDKTHGKFSAVADVETFMLSRERKISHQSAIRRRLGEAVSEGTVNNENLGYFIGRVSLFLTQLGIGEAHVRFRQRYGNELAPHAADCWTAEIECSYGWVQCADIADRSAYDLRTHTEKIGVSLVSHEEFAEPREVEKLLIVPNEKKIGLACEGNEKMVVESLLAMSEEEALQMKAALASKGKVAFTLRIMGRRATIHDDMVEISTKRMREHQRVFTPSVIELSFGIERIMHCLFEHSFYTRPGQAGNEQVNVFRFPLLVAPLECAVFPLRKAPEYESVVQLISRSLTAAGVSHRNYIAGNTIREAYARNDELGVPFAITVHLQVDVTIRERDSEDQVRVSVGEAASVVKEMIDGHRTWSDIWSSFPHHTPASAEEDE
ncbi:glycine--tRNA ligase, mitochondrial 1-like [Rhodamnia argentea]|uniref:glycine--tRNA ligase n=1 Tax=Rhodamnia argentea TaxID=178133 RepID=A0A8B8PZ84_9MYRT|nr:glycine--tRNA ligase, mitochondrial 1-like [Rhodamnia argentea]